MRQPILPIALLLSLITTALANSGGTILFCAELDLVGPCIVQPIEYGRCDNITDSNRLGDIGSSFNITSDNENTWCDMWGDHHCKVNDLPWYYGLWNGYWVQPMPRNGPPHIYRSFKCRDLGW